MLQPINIKSCWPDFLSLQEQCNKDSLSLNSGAANIMTMREKRKFQNFASNVMALIEVSMLIFCFDFDKKIGGHTSADPDEF